MDLAKDAAAKKIQAQARGMIDRKKVITLCPKHAPVVFLIK